MKEDIIKYYPENEIKNREKLISLMSDWKNEISKKDKILFFDDGKKYPPEDYFYLDGFFPNYYNQEMNENNNYGFALMNISKYSNDREDGGRRA